MQVLLRNRKIRCFVQVLYDVFDGTPFLIKPCNYPTICLHDVFCWGNIFSVNETYQEVNILSVKTFFSLGLFPYHVNRLWQLTHIYELLQLWNSGVVLTHSGSPLFTQICKATLLCVACVVPASRNVCRFTGHTSAAGCKKKFKVWGIGEPSD